MATTRGDLLVAAIGINEGNVVVRLPSANVTALRKALKPHDPAVPKPGTSLHAWAERFAQGRAQRLAVAEDRPALDDRRVAAVEKALELLGDSSCIDEVTVEDILAVAAYVAGSVATEEAAA